MINYDQNLIKRMNQAVYSYNRKIANLHSKGYKNTPEQITIKDLKKQYYVRKDLEQKLSEMELFNKRGSEKAVKVGNRWFTQFNIDLFKRRLKTERALVNKEIEKAYEAGNIEDAKQLQNRIELYSKDWQKLMTSAKSYKQIMERRESINTTMDSYISSLFTDLYSIDYPEERIREMEKKLKTLTPRQLQYMLENESIAKSIFDYYHALTRGEEFDDDPVDVINEFYNSLDYLIDKYK